MTLDNFHSYTRRIFALHGARKFQEALAVAEEAAERFPDRSSRTAFWIACLECRIGRPTHALAVLEEALGKGDWWDPHILRSDPDLQPLAAWQGFDGLLSECERRRRTAQTASSRALLVEEPAALDGPAPALMALHWRGGSASESARFWGSATAAGLILALAQSSQVCERDRYGWDDRAVADTDGAVLYAELVSGYPVDRSRLLLGGASQGGALAIAWTLRPEPFGARGFVAVIPSIRELGGLVNIQELEPLIPSAAARGVRGWILTGERDYSRHHVERLHEALIDGGLECRLEVIAGLGHDFPDEFDARLLEAIAFVLA